MGLLQTHAFIFLVGIGLTFKNVDFMLTHYILYRMVPSFLYPQSPNFISKHLTLNFIFCFSVMRFVSSKHLSLNPCTPSNYWTFPSELYKYPIHFEWVSLYLSWLKLFSTEVTNHHVPIPMTFSLLNSASNTMGERLLGILVGFFNFRLLLENLSYLLFFPLLLEKTVVCKNLDL